MFMLGTAATPVQSQLSGLWCHLHCGLFTNTAAQFFISIESDSVMSSLCCDICFDQFSSTSSKKPMVICPNGHSVCCQCSRSMKTCPQCRSQCLPRPIPNISLLKTLGKEALIIALIDNRHLHQTILFRQPGQPESPGSR